MDVKSEIIIPVPVPPVPGPGATVAAGNPAAPPVHEAGGANVTDVAAVQEFLREALNVEPVADRELQIEFENELNVIVVKVLDKESGELIRQIPMPESISIAKGLRAAIRKMANDQSGIAVNEEV